MAKQNKAQKALRRLRSSGNALAHPAVMMIAINQDRGIDVEQTPEPWQGQGKRKKPQRS